ncbi:MAG: c-type cytochrome [Candidatus Brocadiaceae bacterium]|nr:c-type cytochrome [Candidatus Brocadiaceae bacterium]
MNKSMLKITAFGIAVIGFYIYITMYVAGLSGTGSGESAGGVSPEAGEKIFWGDGQCSTCHKIGTSGSATRGPDQEGLASRAEERAKELGMASGLDYLVESIVDPDKYIVKGYDKIMPRVYDPPIMLSREKILAVLAFLQTLGGEPDLGALMKYKDKIPEASKKKVKPWVPPIVVDAAEGEKVFFDETRPVTCGKCHVVNGKGKKVGPELTGIGAIQTAEYFIESILKPSAKIVKGYETMYVITADGIPYNGLIKSETEDELVLLKEESGEIEEVVIPKPEIAEMKKQEVSIMPGNIGELLSVRDFYGIVSFLQSLK